MPKVAKKLSAVEVKRITKPGLNAVGGVSGLHLLVTPGGTRSWILRALIGAKRRDIGLGGYPEVSLEKARDRALEAKDKIWQGIDPVAEKRANRLAIITAQGKQITFEEAARRCYQSKAPEFRNDKHSAQWIGTLESHAFPHIGKMPISEIDLPHVLRVLQPIWEGKTVTAALVRQRMEAVFAWATVSGYRTGDNPARWTGNLKEVLPAAEKLIRRKRRHFPALPVTGIGAFMVELRKKEGTAARALEFAILTATRSGEVRGATWDEIDLDGKVWTIPGGRMKAGKQHRVPLSTEAIRLLKALPRFPGNALVFPAPRGGKFSDMSLLAVIRRMNAEAVPHGFRSTFKDWARTCTAYPDEVSELALAHINSDTTRAAYARDELLPKRAKMMQDWAKYCGTIQKSGKVVQLRKQK